MSRKVNCIKLKKEADGLDAVTYPGECGGAYFNGVSKEAWQMWLSHQTMLINEYRLTPIELRHASFWKKKWRSSSSAKVLKNQKNLLSPKSSIT